MTHVHVRRYVHPEDREAVQREHELTRALEAARTLQERLEMLGDRANDVAIIVSLRNSLGRDLALLGTVVVER